MNCQRSTLPVKPPALTYVGGGGVSTIQRATVTSSSLRCARVSACSAVAMLPIVERCRNARCVRSSRFSMISS